jgi:CubicO group peptidase (beta-lactamase class C family)
VAAITARHRVGLFDETFHCQCDWGLGFAVDNFAMGRHASPRAFGHGGALSAYAFADPEHDLVVALQTNGMCASDDHYHRLDDVMTAMYVDLGIVGEDAPGRDKPMPRLPPVPGL